MPLSNNKQPEDLRPVFIAYPATYSLLMLNYFVYQAKIKFAGIVLTDSHIKVKGRNLSLTQSALLLVKKCGLNYAVYMLFTSKCAYLISAIWNIVSLARGKNLGLKTFKQMAREQRIPIFRSKNINDPATLHFMKNLKINLIVSGYNNQILKYDTCKSFQHKGINIHNSFLPDFGGLDAAFENLYWQVKESGATIHYLDKGIDTGRIISQVKIKVYPQDTVFSLNIRQWLEGACLLSRVLRAFKEGAVSSKNQDSSKTKYSYKSFPQKERVKEARRKGKRLICFRQVFFPSQYLYRLFSRK